MAQEGFCRTETCTEIVACSIQIPRKPQNISPQGRTKFPVIEGRGGDIGQVVVERNFNLAKEANKNYRQPYLVEQLYAGIVRAIYALDVAERKSCRRQAYARQEFREGHVDRRAQPPAPLIAAKLHPKRAADLTTLAD